MIKPLLKLVGIIISFFVLWFLLSRIDWMDILKVDKTSAKTEENIGKLYVELIKSHEILVKSDSLTQPIKDIIDQIKRGNDIDLDIKLHIIRKDDINAFAIPDDNLILYTGLIEECESPEELAGVLGHEIAHMTNNHVMKKLVREVGLSVILSLASGGNESVLQETFKMLTSSAYDRNLESEADYDAAEYLQNADINSRPFADFLFRLSLNEDDRLNHLQLISSHPASEERARSILENLLGDEDDFRPLMSEQKWEYFKANYKNL